MIRYTKVQGGNGNFQRYLPDWLEKQPRQGSDMPQAQACFVIAAVTLLCLEPSPLIRTWGIIPQLQQR